MQRKVQFQKAVRIPQVFDSLPPRPKNNQKCHSDRPTTLLAIVQQCRQVCPFNEPNQWVVRCLEPIQQDQIQVEFHVVL